jgi:hypothetical protein
MTSSSKATTRFCVSHRGQLRCVLTAIEKQDGTVILDLRSRGGAERDKGFVDNLRDSITQGRTITQSRISVHPSNNSLTGISTIKLTKQLYNGEIIKVYHFTPTLTASGDFCPVAFGVCPDPQSETLSFKGRRETIKHLGDMDDWFTLYWSVFVSHQERSWNFEPQDNQMQIYQINIGSFNFLLLYSFLSITPLSSGMVAIATNPANSPFSPIPEAKTLAFAKWKFSDMKIKMVSSFIPTPSPALLGTISASRFFRIGVTTNPQFQSWRRDVIANGLFDPLGVRRAHRSVE